MISVFYSTRTENSAFKERIQNSCTLQDIEIIELVNNGQYSLSEAYTTALETSKHNILVCVHDDIYLEKGWDKKILDYFESSDYGILGLAGTTNIPESGMWWENRSMMVGQVQHKKDGKWHDTNYSQQYPKKIFEVAAIDGLFIAINKSNLKFKKFITEIGGFHFYDIPFCLENSLQGTKIGVVTDIKIKHESIGAVNAAWFQNKAKFVEFYKEYLPYSIVPKIPYETRKVHLKREPKLAIIIPTKDNYELLSTCISSLTKTDYKNYKIYIADTGSETTSIKKTKEFLLSHGISSEVILYDYYHFSKINNDIVKRHIDSDTEIILFCNDDIEMVNDAISLMVEEYLNSPKTVGTIGCRLHYPNNKIQHGGIVCFFNKENRMGLSHLGINTYYNAAFNRKGDVLGSTGAFLMIKKVLFDGIGGFSEKTNDCMEDVLLNMDCIIRSYKNVYLGEAVCYHHESVTRKKNPKKVEMEIKDMTENVIPKISKNMNKLKKHISVAQ